MKASRIIACVLSFLTATGILLQWVLVWSGKFPVTESVPGFRNYFYSFIVADLWLILAASMTGIFILLKDPRALLFGIALGSAMVFFGLYSTQFLDCFQNRVSVWAIPNNPEYGIIRVILFKFCKTMQ